jgi:hypothetical protein
MHDHKELNLRHVDVWRGTHRGIHYTIKRFDSVGLDGEKDHDCWAHYINLHEAQVPEGVLDRVFLPRRGEKDVWAWYDGDSSLLAGIKWHCGMTYYEYLRDVPGYRVVEAGCDYSHLWDEEAGYPYDLQWVQREAQETIDSLIVAIPELRFRCGWTGKYCPVSDALPWGERGGVISPEGEAKRQESNQ